jgi:c-di-GMP-binding flagellar brake protein YcgR
VATYAGYDSGGLKFKRPQKLFKVQRRQDIRMPILDSVAFKVEFEDPLDPGKKVQKKVLDLSASGLAFLIQTSEEPIYHAGMKIQGVTFRIKGHKISCTGEVRHMKALPASGPNKGIKVGIKLHGMHSADNQALLMWVTEESRKYFMRFMA